MLRDGLYEQVINKGMDTELASADKLSQTAPIDTAEASKVLAKYVAEVVERGLDNLRDNGGDLNAQVALANQIITTIQAETKEADFDSLSVAERAEQLLALFDRQNSIWALDEKTQVVRPETSIAQSSLFTGAVHEPQMYTELKKEIVSCNRIDMLVSFIKWSGLRLIMDELTTFTQNGGELRIITTSYMGATDVKAIEELRKLPNTQIKVSYNTKITRLHAKAYIFYRDTGFTTAYVGSSNLSNAALTSGLEWNTKITKKDLPETIDKVAATFEFYWNDKEFEYYDEGQRERLARALQAEKYFDSNNAEIFNMEIRPYSYQQEILDKLEAERTVRGYTRNLVVAATGTGKTVISALDFKAFQKKNQDKTCRLLFIAHREEILKESNSISNQKQMLLSYAKKHSLLNPRVYVDDGYTGTNFNRPDFQRLLEDIELGYVTTVIVKDMSRLGREYLQVGYYTEQYFPDHNIRFIAINDGVDTVTGVDETTELAPFRNVMNEFYARDISRKVRSAHNTRGRAGEPLSQPPYGYKKDPENRKHWIIDPDAAAVVREIFKLYLEGNGTDTIARIMQDEGHLNCTAYWASKGIGRGGKKTQPNDCKWKCSTINGILHRQEYCGDVINFKTSTKSFKNHKRIDNPKEDWLVFPDRHEAIIDRATFEKVQQLLATTKPRKPKEINGPKSIFCDLLRCADCGKKLWYHTNTVNRDIHFFSCSNYTGDYRGSCVSRHYIRADAVATVVEMELRRLADYLAADEDRFAELLAQKSNKQMEAEKRTVQGELHAAEMRLELLPKLLKNLYEDKVSGKMSEEDYAILSREYAEERETLKKKVKAHRDRLRRIEQSEGEREQFIRVIRKFMEMRTLTNQILRELIDHIDVYEVEGRGKNRTQRMVIYYKFVGYLEIPSHLSAPNYKADLRQGVAVEYVSCEPTDSARELFDEDCGAVEEEQ